MLFCLLFAHRLHSGLSSTDDWFNCVWVVWPGGYACRNEVLENRWRKLCSKGEDCCSWRSVFFTAR